MLCCIIIQNKNFVDAKELSKSEMADMYEKVISVVQPMNIDNLKVGIKDSVNVVDAEGALCGYSFGYEVDEKPYGYAIYDIYDKSVKEFVFCEGVSNMYTELEEKAEDDPNVDEEELLEGIVYEGGIDYCVYDNEGEKIELNDDITNTGNDSCSEDAAEDIVFDNIADSDYMAPCSIYYNDGFEMCEKNDYWDVHDNNTSWCVVPDCGLAMVSGAFVDYYKKDYACTNVAATGIINWMGRGKGSVINTYCSLYDYLDSRREIEHIPAKDNSGNIEYDENGKVKYSGHGIYFSDMADALDNYYFPSVNCNTCAIDWDDSNDRNLRFSDFENHIGSVSNGELAPCMLGIWVYYDYCNNIINGKITDDFAHAVTVLSTLRNSDDKYIGIWNGWNYNDEYHDSFSANEITEDGLLNNVDTLSSAYRAIRYISWSDLHKDNVSIDAIFFENVQSANIKEVHVNYLSSKTIEMSCYVPSGTKHVYFPTWDSNGNQSDVIWHEGQINSSNNMATVTIDLSKYNNNTATVTYATDIYARDKNGNNLAMYSRCYNTVNKTIRNIKISEITNSGYTVTCNVPTGTTYVRFPTWTNSNGQDDLVWHVGELTGDTARIRINTSDHNPESGKYITHIYAYDKYNQVLSSAGTETIIGSITNISIYNKTIHGFAVKCTLPKGTVSVRFPTWSNINGQDDLVWYVGTVNNGMGSINIDTSDHCNDGGIYNIHIYAYDQYGNCITLAGTTTNVYSRKTINTQVTSKTSEGYKLYTYLPTGTAKVRYYVQAIEAGRYGVRDYIYNTQNNTSGTYSKTINISEYMNAKGVYSNDIYAYDIKGKLIGTIHRSVNIE